MRKLFDIGARIVFGVLIFAVLAAAILTRPPKSPNDFDQAYYLTIAYDLDHHGVFSNGLLDDVNSTVAVPPPGMFFGPLYPWLIAGVTKIDARFATSVDCAVEANHGARPDTECEIYVQPMHLIHALLLALGVLAVARAAEVMFARRMVFWLAGALATGALLAEADVFSFLMTESMTFSLYSDCDGMDHVEAPILRHGRSRAGSVVSGALLVSGAGAGHACSDCSQRALRRPSA
jgi:hypothetical protein